MSKQIRYLMLRSAQQRMEAQRRMRRMQLLHENEIKQIEGEDPLCPIQKTSSKKMLK
jgi:hypothetical protein